MQTPKETHMKAPEAKTTKMVKIKALRDIRLLDGRTLLPEMTAEVSEEEAKEFCERPSVPAHFAFSGERPNNEVQRHEQKRAVRL